MPASRNTPSTSEEPFTLWPIHPPRLYSASTPEEASKKARTPHITGVASRAAAQRFQRRISSRERFFHIASARAAIHSSGGNMLKARLRMSASLVHI